ncbi:hypothetical protein CRYUN_Cryun33cG0106400 [Craigia yunnanensis]
MKSFWKNYSGQEVAPVPTIFIDGNHEASNYLWELYYEEWAAPNIYFLGFAGVVKFGNIRIGGLSGIYNSLQYHLGHHERPPYNDSTIRFSRELLEARLLLTAQLLEKLKPSYWFSAHLHCKFTALVQHEEGGSVTKFLALDKFLPGRKFLQVSIISLTVSSRNTQLDMQDCRQWVRSRLEDRGAKPCEFLQTVPPYNPSHRVSNITFSGYPAILGLHIPIEDEDEVEDFEEVDNTETDNENHVKAPPLSRFHCNCLPVFCYSLELMVVNSSNSQQKRVIEGKKERKNS